MTEEQKEILISRMIDTPLSLSDKDMEAILTDDELRDIYEVSSTVRGACIRQPEIDMPEEWKRFRRRIHKRPTKIRWVMRVAAIFLGVLFFSGVVKKMIDHSLTTNEQPMVAKLDHQAQHGNILTITSSTRPSESQENTIAETLICKNQASASNQHRAKAKTTKQKKEPKETTIDIDEYLRIQQARIDNDIAMQAAEIYMEEYNRLLSILDATGTNSPYLDNVIRKTTMQ